jgi:hypothetical protein
MSISTGEYLPGETDGLIENRIAFDVAAGDKLFHLAFIKKIVLLYEVGDEAYLAEQNFDKPDIGHCRFRAVLRQGYQDIAAVSALGFECGGNDAEVADLCYDWFVTIVNLGAEFFYKAVAEMQFGKTFRVAGPVIALPADEYHDWAVFRQNIKNLTGNLLV